MSDTDVAKLMKTQGDPGLVRAIGIWSRVGNRQERSEWVLPMHVADPAVLEARGPQSARENRRAAFERE